MKQIDQLLEEADRLMTRAGRMGDHCQAILYVVVFLAIVVVTTTGLDLNQIATAAIIAQFVGVAIQMFLLVWSDIVLKKAVRKMNQAEELIGRLES